ncbi:MAG: cytochrome bd ubiquinol oxidase subunit [Gaiellales bacterium]|nr:cytochrome bd ubiquinol oxidase subunit [Gaiellales bacterium]
MSLAEVPLLVVLAGLIAYVVLAGADFGAGFWQLTPGQGEREQAVRAYARDAIRPVWEANHVWLILVLTVTWTCYPGAFAAIASSLAAPLTLAALGIVLRAIGYVVGGEADSPRGNRVLELTFALSSILVPFMLGAAVGGIASGRVPPGNARGDLITSWLNPTSIAIGAVAVATTAYISAVWLTADSSRDDRADLVESFRTRALGSAIVTGLIAFASLIVVRSDDGHLWHGLTRWPGIAAVLVSAIAGAGALGLVATRRFGPARPASVVAVAAIITGWALAQRPELLPGLTISQAAASRATLVATLLGLAVGSLILIPSLGILFRMVLQGTFSEEAPPRLAVGSGLAFTDPRRQASLVVVALVVGTLVLVVGDAAWSIAIGAGLLLFAGACGFVLVARSLVPID